MACAATLKRSLDFDPLHSPPQPTPLKRRRYMPLTMAQTTQPTKLHQTSSTFIDVSQRLTKEDIAARIGSELKRMQRRRQLFYPSYHSHPSNHGRLSPPMISEPMGSPSSSLTVDTFLSISVQSPSGSSSPQQKDIPLFTFKQVTMICDRMLREQEEKIRQNYDTVLNKKLSEQYEAFLKFNHDQLQKHFGNAPMSYVS